jgi:soluble lytic murein transglycosylase-like protein
MILRPPKFRLLRLGHCFSLQRLRPIAGCLSISLLLALPSQAAESIAAHLDSNGRLVFVNEPAPTSASSSKIAAPKASSSSSSPAQPKAEATSASRRVINSTQAPDSLPAVENLGSAIAQPPALAPAALGSPESAVASATASRSADLNSLIEQAAMRHQVDPELVKAIVKVESNFNPRAVSPAGALGLMQLIPATAMRFGVANPFDPQANLDGGVRYLKYLLGQYEGNVQLSLAAYNAGEDAVARSGGMIPSIRETQDYIRKIAQLYPQQAMSATGLPPAPSIEKFVDSSGVVHFSNTDF